MAATKVLNWVIYVLKCPRTSEIRYVGWTRKTPEQRVKDHVREAVNYPFRTHRLRWVMSLVSIGLVPLIEVVESGCGDGWSEAERHWIAVYRAKGAHLVNGTEGGQCVVLTPEQFSARSRKAQAARAANLAAKGEPHPKIHARLTEQERKAIGARLLSSSTHEQRSEWAKARWAARTAAERTAIRMKGHASMTPEQRSAAGRKGAAVRAAMRTTAG